MAQKKMTMAVIIGDRCLRPQDPHRAAAFHQADQHGNDRQYNPDVNQSAQPERTVHSR